MDVLRGVFLVAVLGFAFWGLHDRGGELLDTVQRTSVLGLGVAAALVLAGLLVTSVAWLRLLAGYGHRMPPGEGQRVFFVGQLGKYIPGSVWSMGAHADLARGFDVPMRVTVGTSLMFLWLNLATSGLVAGLLAVSGWWRPGLPPWLVVLGLVGCVVGLLPPVVGRIGSRLASAARSKPGRWRRSAIGGSRGCSRGGRCRIYTATATPQGWSRWWGARPTSSCAARSRRTR